MFGFLGAYADEEGIGRGRYFLLLLVRYVFGGVEIPAGFYLGFALVLLAALAGRAVFRWSEREGGFLFSAGVLAFAFTFLLSPQFAWYWSWIIPFLAFLPWSAMLPLFLFTAAALIHYATWFDDWRFGLHPHLALGFLQFVPFGVLLAVLYILGRKRPGLSSGLEEGWSTWKHRPPEAGINAAKLPLFLDE